MRLNTEYTDCRCVRIYQVVQYTGNVIAVPIGPYDYIINLRAVYIFGCHHENFKNKSIHTDVYTSGSVFCCGNNKQSGI